MRGETTRFHLRYFEVAPGGYTTFEHHEHEHVVYALRGKGIFRTQDERIGVGAGDIVYICPSDPHQFANEGKEPFGFLCIVNADRDRPVPIQGGDDSSCLGEQARKIIEEAEKE